MYCIVLYCIALHCIALHCIGDESSEDIVLNDTLASMSESETEKTSDEYEIEENVEDVFTTTRSGRVTTY